MDIALDAIEHNSLSQKEFRMHKVSTDTLVCLSMPVFRMDTLPLAIHLIRMRPVCRICRRKTNAVFYRDALLGLNGLDILPASQEFPQLLSFKFNSKPLVQ